MGEAEGAAATAEAKQEMSPAEVEAFAQALREQIEGEVRFDDLSRGLYCTDASNYQIMPMGVVLPKNRDDVIKVVRLCAEKGVVLTPRGGGTALCGQSVGRGIILDVSKYMNNILEVNPAEKWARVQPGVVLDQLNAELKDLGLHFAPDVATSSRATVGGMISNNSAGAHSLLFGMTIDHVLEVDVVLSDGSVVTLKEVGDDEAKAKAEGDTLEARCYETAMRLGREMADEIDKRYPKILRRVGGYNLNKFVPGQKVNLANMVVGAEGTLAVVLDARVNLVPLPKAKAVCVVHFETINDALVATAKILEHKPSAVEYIDDNILKQTAGSREYSQLRKFVVGEPEALLAVEFFGEKEEELVAKIERLEADLRSQKLGYHYHRAIPASEQARIWELRKAGLGLLMSMKGDSKPVAFIEDTAVPPEVLPEYIGKLLAIIKEEGASSAMYAHASVGCLHVRPILNLKSAEGVRQYGAIAERAADLVIQYGGANSGEHGDGRARSPFMEKVYGSKLYEAFREVKRTFDPDGILNPGLIVDADPVTAHLRYGVGFKTTDIPTTFDFTVDGGIQRAAELCSGVGHCRKRTEGTMCPSYMATMEEMHSTRGRANTLRLAMSGQLGSEGLLSPEVKEALDLCLECKACKSECPTFVDMAKLKYEFLHQWQKKHGVPRRSKMFAHIERLMAMGSAFAPLSSWAVRSMPGRLILEWLFGIDHRRKLAPFQRQTFTKWFEARGGRVGKVPEDADPAKSVLLFHDTFLTYSETNIGKSVVRLLEAAGWTVYLPDKKCCGRPMISKGLLDEAIANATYNVEKLHPLVERGFKIIGCEPSCILSFRDDYVDLLRGKLKEKAKAVGAACQLFEEFLADRLEDDSIALQLKAGPEHILLHGHCHQKSLAGTDATRAILSRIPDCTVEEIDSGCCGMAGSFGYEKEHFEVSQQVGERRLLPAVREAAAGTVVVAPGTSCRQQIRDLAGGMAWHPAELLATLLK